MDLAGLCFPGPQVLQQHTLALGLQQDGALLTTVLFVAGREKYPAPAGVLGRTDLFDDPSYVNVQNMDKTRQAAAAGTPATANGSAQRDLFDMSECDGGHGRAWPGGCLCWSGGGWR